MSRVTLEDLEDCVRERLRVSPPGAWWFLEGDLGAGKTQFTRVLAQVLGVPSTQSPTFPVLNVLTGPARTLVHLDLYRIRWPQELLYLGLDAVWSEDALVCVEWANRLSPEEWTGCFAQLGMHPCVVRGEFRHTGEDDVREISWSPY